MFGSGRTRRRRTLAEAGTPREEIEAEEDLEADTEAEEEEEDQEAAMDFKGDKAVNFKDG